MNTGLPLENLQTNTESVLKPTINAAKHTLDTGQAKITETNLVIRGNGPANVAAIGIDLDLTETFDSVTVESDEYDWDFTEL